MYVASARRIAFVALCWGGITIAVCRDPMTVLFALPITGLVFLLAILGVVTELRTALSSREQLSHTQREVQRARPLLVLLVGCSIAGAIASVFPSMAFRPEGENVIYEHGLSRSIAPALWTVILGACIAAIVRPTPRRFALAAGSGVLAWPLFLGIRALREPWFDIDDEHVVLAPWALQLYVGAALLASGLALGLAFVSARAAARPVPLPAKAFVSSGS
jgi:hypothetical protein